MVWCNGLRVERSSTGVTGHFMFWVGYQACTLPHYVWENDIIYNAKGGGGTSILIKVLL